MSEENSGGKTNGPSFDALAVQDGKDGKSFYHKIGVAFAHKDGKGHTLDLAANPVNGRVVLRTPQERLQAAKDGSAQDKPAQARERGE